MTSQNESAGVGESDNNERQRSANCNENSVLAINNIGLVAKSEEELADNQYKNDDHKTNTNFALSAVLDSGRGTVKSIVGAGTANRDEDDGRKHQQVDGTLIESINTSATLALDSVEETIKQTQENENQWTKTETIKDDPANVEVCVVRVVNSSEKHGRANEAGEREDADVEPSSIAGEAMGSAEEEGAEKEECVYNDLSDGDLIVGIDRASHGVCTYC